MNRIHKSWNWKKVFLLEFKKDVNTHCVGKDALLIDLSDRNNLGGGGVPAPPGFFGYPQPPPLPVMDQQPVPFSYPVSLFHKYVIN